MAKRSKGRKKRQDPNVLLGQKIMEQIAKETGAEEGTSSIFDDLRDLEQKFWAYYNDNDPYGCGAALLYARDYRAIMRHYLEQHRGDPNTEHRADALLSRADQMVNTMEEHFQFDDEETERLMQQWKREILGEPQLGS